jgi:nucleoside recognition membrane protein YjiH
MHPGCWKKLKEASLVSEEKKDFCEPPKLQVSWKGYLALAFAIVFFSGLLAGQTGWITAMDFNTLAGKFGTMKDAAKATFQGQEGLGARDGFMFAFGLIPSVMLALGVVEVIDHLGGLKAAEKLLSPILRPLLGIPGIAGLAMVTSFQSTDAGAGMTRILRETNCITEKEKTIFSAFQFSAGGTVTNYLAIGPAVFGVITVPIVLPLIVMFALKFFGANLVRIYLNRFEKEVD